MIYSVILLFLLTICGNIEVTHSKGVSVCYYRDWAQYSKGKAKFLPENIDPDICSVVNYGQMAVDLRTHKLKAKQWNAKVILGRLLKLKGKNKALKIFISVGGWNHEKKPRYSLMVRTMKRRRIFIKSVIRYLHENKLDGVSLDWEYPALRGSPKKDKQRFVLLLKELRKALDKFAKKNVKRIYLTIAVSSNPKKIKVSDDIPGIAKYVDWINVMAYNLRGPWRKKTGCPTLTKGPKPNVPDAINTWIKGGMPPGKINLGLATYGRTFKLVNRKLYGLDAPCSGTGKPGKYTRKKGILAYYEICRKPWTRMTSASASTCGTPYASRKNQWCAYDDPASIRNKVKTIVNKQGLNGVSIWALDFDDFHGDCSKKGITYPLLRAAVEEMKSAKNGSPSIVKPTTKPTKTKRFKVKKRRRVVVRRRWYRRRNYRRKWYRRRNYRRRWYRRRNYRRRWYRQRNYRRNWYRRRWYRRKWYRRRSYSRRNYRRVRILV